MKIACVGNGWYPQTPGGLEKYLYGMTHELTATGDEVDLFVTGSPECWDDRSHVYSLAKPGKPLVQRALSARRCFARYFREPYDVVNLHFAMTALPLIPFIDHSAPRVVHFHGPWADESRAEGGDALSVSAKRILERFVYRRADHFIVLSNSFKELLARTYCVDEERISVIPMGIDTDFFHPALDRGAIRSDLGWPAEAFIIFTARRLITRVGLIELVHAFSIVRAQHRDAVLKIAGSGPLLTDLQRLIQELGLAACIELLGFVPEATLVRAYQAADVTILPTQALEGFGTIISESLACGTPVLVTPVGGMPEAVAPLASRLIAQSPSSVDIANILIAALSGALRLPDPDTCRAYALAHFDWTLVWLRVRDVFERARHRL